MVKSLKCWTTTAKSNDKHVWRKVDVGKKSKIVSVENIKLPNGKKSWFVITGYENDYAKWLKDGLEKKTDAINFAKNFMRKDVR